MCTMEFHVVAVAVDAAAPKAYSVQSDLIGWSNFYVNI